MQTPDKAYIVILMIIVMKLTLLVAAASSIKHLNNSICHHSGPHGMQTGLRITLAVCLSTAQNTIIYERIHISCQFVTTNWAFYQPEQTQSCS